MMYHGTTAIDQILRN